MGRKEANLEKLWIGWNFERYAYNGTPSSKHQDTKNILRSINIQRTDSISVLRLIQSNLDSKVPLVEFLFVYTSAPQAPIYFILIRCFSITSKYINLLSIFTPNCCSENRWRAQNYIFKLYAFMAHISRGVIANLCSVPTPWYTMIPWVKWIINMIYWICTASKHQLCTWPVKKISLEMTTCFLKFPELFLSSLRHL